jgi:hypothetical protein
MKKWTILTVLAAVVSLSLAGFAGGTAAPWQPPIGIPAPSFGIDEIAPAPPFPWDAAVPNFYYVDEGNALSTDTSNAYGYPARPRKTIPRALPAGSVVILNGTYSFSHASPNVIVSSGTAANPVWIRGLDAGANRPTATKKWTVAGSYLVVENIYFNHLGQTTAGLTFSTGASADHVAIRNCEMRGDPAIASGIRVGGTSGVSYVHSNIVVYRNDLHDLGDPLSTVDQDSHCISIGAYANNVWILENELHYSSGSGLQVNAGSLASMATTHHVYAGRNHVYRTRQAGLAIKQATDVVFSQNRIHDVIETTWSASKGIGFQYAPERVWFLYNHVYNCTYGIYAGSNSGLGFGTESYIIGNVIHDISNRGVYSATWAPANSWASSAIMLAGGVNRYIVNNTLWRNNAGIYIPIGSGNVEMANNVIGGRTEPEGRDILLEGGTLSTTSRLGTTLFGSSVPPRIQWANATIYSVPAFQAATGNGVGCITDDPAFLSATDNNFRTSPVSPVLDKGVSHPVYSTFFSLYGIDVLKDGDGNFRPMGAGVDLGAYEVAGAISTKKPAAPVNLYLK